MNENEIELFYYDDQGNLIDKNKSGKTDSDVWTTIASSLGALLGAWKNSSSQTSTQPAQVPTIQMGNSNNNTMIIALFGLVVVMMFLFFMQPSKKR